MTEPVKWKDEYVCGLVEVDIQHKKLFRIAEDLYYIAQQPKDEYKKSISRIIKSLVDYTKYHFETEESLMKEYLYPFISAHSQMHSDFILETISQLSNLSDVNPADGLELYEFLCNWIVQHICDSDKKFASYVYEAKNNFTFT